MVCGLRAERVNIGPFGSNPSSQIAQSPNHSLSMVPGDAGVPLGISEVEDKSSVCN